MAHLTNKPDLPPAQLRSHSLHNANYFCYAKFNIVLPLFETRLSIMIGSHEVDQVWEQ